ncbi:hypothetical protein [Streptomyces sp. NBC_00887]|uniref:hypothetical protein n=1 Tax=Streptomyces sp. NBC_00887 TaxID=2975859 RepID=UPI0038636503|nr:hypothetical protein OG844_10470 [Streptomyces sp. NBC_00887]
MTTTVRQAVRDIVTAFAPHELVALDGLEPLNDAQVTRLFARRDGGEDPLGFGLTEVTALVVPVVWLVVNEVATRGADMAADGLLARMRSAADRMLRRSSPQVEAMPPLSSEQLEAVHSKVLGRAADAGIEGRQAQALADAVVSRLARETST